MQIPLKSVCKATSYGTVSVWPSMTHPDPRQWPPNAPNACYLCGERLTTQADLSAPADPDARACVARPGDAPSLGLQLICCYGPLWWAERIGLAGPLS